MLVNIGHNNYIEEENLIALLEYKSAPIKRLIDYMLETDRKKVIDVTKGRKVETVVLMKDNVFILSPIGRKTLANRLGIFQPRGKGDETAKEDNKENIHRSG